MDAVALVALFSSILSSLAFAITAFGTGITYHCLWTICALLEFVPNSFVAPSIHIAIITPLVGVFQSLVMWNDIDWHLVLLVGLPACFAALLSTVLLSMVPDSMTHYCQQAIGFILCVLTVWQCYVEGHRQSSRSTKLPTSVSPKVESPNFKLVSIMAGIASGLMGGFYGIAGPPLIVYVLWVDLDPTRWRASAGIINPLASSIARWPVLIARDMLRDVSVFTYICLILGCVSGLYVGIHYVLPLVSPKGVRWFLVGFLAISSVLMCSSSILLLLLAVLTGLVIVSISILMTPHQRILEKQQLDTQPHEMATPSTVELTTKPSSTTTTASLVGNSTPGVTTAAME